MADIRQALATLRSARRSTERKLTRLDHAIRALRKLTVGTPPTQRRGASKARRKMSAAARRKIAAAQRARWAKIRKQKKAA